MNCPCETVLVSYLQVDSAIMLDLDSLGFNVKVSLISTMN